MKQDDFDYVSLGKAQDIIYFWGQKIGRVGGQLKEKYGTIRWYAEPRGARELHDLVYPGYAYFQWRANTHPVMYTINKVSAVYFRLLDPLIRVYKRFFYAYAYHRAVKKFPHLYREILCCCEEDDILFKSEKKLINIK